MAKKELWDEITEKQEINEVDGELIYHANEGGDEGEEEDEKEKEAQS